MNDYCANYLAELGLFCRKDLLINLSKPFPNVEKFWFADGDLNCQSIKFNDWLQNLQNLYFDLGVRFGAEDLIHRFLKYFPQQYAQNIKTKLTMQQKKKMLKML